MAKTKAEEKPLTKTQEVLLRMMRQNAGGGMTGWRTMAAANQERDLEHEPAVSLDYDEHDKTVSLRVSLYCYLNHFLQYDETLDAKFQEWSEENAPDHGQQTMRCVGAALFPDKEVSGRYDQRDAEVKVLYTYNEENFLSQDFQFALLFVFEKGANKPESVWVLVQTHNGTDARWGLSDIHVFKMREGVCEYNECWDFMNWSNGDVGCSKNHCWITENARYSFYPQHDVSADDKRQLGEFKLKQTKAGRVKCPLCTGRSYLYGSTRIDGFY